MKAKKTLILGASTNPMRYANIAANRLVGAGHPIKNIGLKSGIVAGEEIHPAGEIIDDIHTITLYLNPKNQQPFYDYILATQPKRVIFNPGTENPVLTGLLKEQGIQTEEACTLVLLSTGMY